MTAAVRIAFIGTGGIAGQHLKHLDALQGAVRIVALCDVVEDRARAAAAQYGGAVFTDSRRLFDVVGHDLDAVYVCVPPHAHADVERLAAQAGLHLFVEKPVILDLEAGLETLEAIRTAGVLSSVGYSLRYRYPWRTAHDLLAASGLTVSMICADRWSGMPGDAGHWWRRQDKSGGQLHEQTTHQVDSMRWIAGDVARVHACYGRRIAASIPGMSIPDAQVVALEFTSGAVGYVSCVCTLTRGGGGNTMHVICGDVAVQVGRHLEVQPQDALEAPREPVAYEDIDAAFVRAVATGDGRAILCDYEEGLKSAAVSIAANESANRGQAVRVWQGE